MKYSFNIYYINSLIVVIGCLYICMQLVPIGLCQTDTEMSLSEQIESYQKQLAADATRIDIRLQLAKIYLQIEGYDQAIVEYREVISSVDAMSKYAYALPDGFYGLGLAYSGLEKFNKSIEAFKRALQFAPERAHIHAALGSAYASLHQYENALDSYKEANKLQPDDAMIHHQLGNIYSKRGKRSNAIIHHQKAIALSPNLAAAHYQLGLLYSQENRLDEAISSYETAYENDPELIEALYNLAQTQVRNGNRQEARNKMQLYERRKVVVKPIQELRGTLQRTREPVQRAKILANIGRLYLKSEDYEKAIWEYEKALALNPQVVEAYNGVGIAYTMRNRFSEAIDAQQYALKLQPDFAEAHAGLGLVYLAQKKDELALKHYKQTLMLIQKRNETRKNKFEEEVNLKIGFILLKHKRYSEAVPVYQAVIELNQDNAEAYHNLGVCYAHQQKTDKALSALQKAIEIAAIPQNSNKSDTTNSSQPSFLPDTYYLIGELHGLQQSYAKAESAYLSSGLPKAYNALAQLTAKQASTIENPIGRDKKMDMATSYAEKAILLDPNTASHHNTLALIAFRLGEYNIAERSIRKAISLEPNNQNYQEGLKAILAKMSSK